MKFSEYLKSIEGKFVNVYTSDMATGKEGDSLPAYGRLIAHDDFIELIERATPVAIPIRYITCVCVMVDQESCMLKEMEAVKHQQ